jgi:hypothetical protein
MPLKKCLSLFAYFSKRKIMNIVKFEEIENKIIEIRGQKTILDSDVAKLYGVATRDINKSVKNNPYKFPSGYIFELTTNEKQYVVENFHHIAQGIYRKRIERIVYENYNQLDTCF